MSDDRVLIICTSVHHQNTFKIAEALAEELNAKIIKPSEFRGEDLDSYDLIGFGSGIYNGKHHPSLLSLASDLDTQTNKKAFIFSTSTILAKSMHRALKDNLQAKGYQIIGEFCCRGFMNHSFTKYILGGLNKNRPNADDLEEAKQFARKMIEKS